MSMKPILFNTEMVRAILDGRKTVTRRVMKPQPPECFVPCEILDHWDSIWVDGIGKVKLPYRVGDILYIPEAWRCFGYVELGSTEYTVEFRDREVARFNFQSMERAQKWAKYLYKPRHHWQSPYFMPKEAARIFLRVTDVWVERLTDPFFTNPSAAILIQREGIDIGDTCHGCIENYGHPSCIDHFEDDEDECGMLDEIRYDFSKLWDNTVPRHPNKFKRYPYYWNDNPWVWVIEFERISKEEATR